VYAYTAGSNGWDNAMPTGTDGKTFAVAAVELATTERLKIAESTTTAGGGGDGGGGDAAGASGGGATHDEGSLRVVPGGHEPCGTP
jgi:hypothetical protein